MIQAHEMTRTITSFVLLRVVRESLEGFVAATPGACASLRH
jgi:hypothetical protein